MNEIFTDAQLLDAVEGGGYLFRAALVCGGERIDLRQDISAESEIGVRITAALAARKKDGWPTIVKTSLPMLSFQKLGG